MILLAQVNWSPARKGLTSWLSLVMFIAFLLLSCMVSWVGRWYLIVSFPDLCLLFYFVLDPVFPVNVFNIKIFTFQA